MKIKFGTNITLLLSYILCTTILSAIADENVNPIEAPVPMPRSDIKKPNVINFVSPPVSHVTPAILNDTALRKWITEGNRSAALILLERAHRLAPSNTVIAHNLELVRKNALGDAKTQPIKYLTANPDNKTASVVKDTNQNIWSLP